MKHRKVLFVLLLCFTAFYSCESDFLDVKRDQSLVVPKTIADYQSLMDNQTIMNDEVCSELAIVGSDEIGVSDAVYAAIPRPYQKNAYIWAKEIYDGIPHAEWNKAYWRILYANTATDGAAVIKPSAENLQAHNTLKGTALFHRAFNFYQLAQTYCKPYNSSSAATDSGIPIRLEADINLKSDRGTVEKTYRQIVKDLTAAAELLPQVRSFTTQPNKAAAYALLAKTYLVMQDYPRAGSAAEQSLKLYSELNDFNKLDLSKRYTFPADYHLNKEILFFAGISNIAILTITRLNIPSAIINGYEANDLRKQAYFFNNTDGRILSKGSLRGTSACFTGIATGEVFLILAECQARNGETAKAINTLNVLRKHRYDKNSYADLIASEAGTALDHVLLERKRELFLRGTRWEDLRRLNTDPQRKVTLTRVVAGVTYSLLPEDQRYVWPIPENEVLLSNFVQNPR